MNAQYKASSDRCGECTRMPLAVTFPTENNRSLTVQRSFHQLLNGYEQKIKNLAQCSGSRNKHRPTLIELRFYIPLDTKQVISEMLFPANIMTSSIRKQKINKSSAVAEMGNRLATICMGRKLRGCAPLF